MANLAILRASGTKMINKIITIIMVMIEHNYRKALVRKKEMKVGNRRERGEEKKERWRGDREDGGGEEYLKASWI